MLVWKEGRREVTSEKALMLAWEKLKGKLNNSKAIRALFKDLLTRF